LQVLTREDRDMKGRVKMALDTRVNEKKGEKRGKRNTAIINLLSTEKQKIERPQWESNPRPSDPKSDALIHCAMRSRMIARLLYANYTSIKMENSNLNCS
jgi:hypothetical protein